MNYFKGLLTLFLCTLYVSGFSGTSWKNAREMLGQELPDSPASIKVLIKKDVNSAGVEVKGPYRVYDPKTQKRKSFGFLGKAFPITTSVEGIRWGQLFPDVFQIKVIPDDASNLIVVNNVLYQGRLNVYDVDGKLYIVNEVPIEDYIQSTMITNFPHVQSKELLLALSILCRTTAVHQKEHPVNPFWDLDAADVNFRGYYTVRNHELASQAVKETASMVMTGPDADTFHAVCTAHSAGKLIPYSKMFRMEGGGGMHQVVSAPLAEANRQQSMWSVPVNKKDLAVIAKLAKLDRVELFADKESRKVYGVRFFDGEEYHELSFFALQAALGEDQLKSSEFSVSQQGDQIVFSGYGRGPGVGLCLYSAQKMAEQGRQGDDILRTFFPNTQIVLHAGKMPAGHQETVPETDRLAEKPLTVHEENNY